MTDSGTDQGSARSKDTRIDSSADLERLKGNAPSKPRNAPTATVMRLAEKLGRDPQELADEIPADTLRRTRHAVVVEEHPDGKTLYKQQVYQHST